MKEEEVVLVDTQDNFLGTMPKMEAHQKGILHRAFSIFLLNSDNELLLQKRSNSKYHSPGLWTNACCSHQRIDETSIQAGNRRLKEEMGITADLIEAFTFIYKTSFNNGLTEHEFDHVLIGYSNEIPKINIHEVSEWRWSNIEFVKNDILMNPTLYTVWFKIILDQFINYINKDESYSK
jgi:isopentenyl-diphosphate delta-isomerase